MHDRRSAPLGRARSGTPWTLRAAADARSGVVALFSRAIALASTSFRSDCSSAFEKKGGALAAEKAAHKKEHDECMKTCATRRKAGEFDKVKHDAGD